MPAIAELIDRATAARLAAVRAEAGQRERAVLEAAAVTPVQPAVCPECGQPRPVPAAVFRDGR